MVHSVRGLGEVDQVVKWLEKGIEERKLGIVCSLKYWQAVDPLLDHPRYQALLRKMNLED